MDGKHPTVDSTTITY